MLVVSPVCGWYFILYRGWDWGAAIASITSMIVFILLLIGIVIHSGYGFVFKPLPIGQVLTKKGLFQNAFEWIIQEVAIILAGYVVDSTIALSTTVILSNVNVIPMAFMIGISNAANVRTGKYIGKADIVGAKR